MPKESNITCDNELLARGFVQIPVLVFQEREIHAGAKVIYGGLLWYRWRGLDYPGHAKAAIDWGLSENSIVRYMKQLEALGLVVETRPGLGQPNRYHLPDPVKIITGCGMHNP